MHERSPKNSPLDTILYEIDMLRHCARALPSKYASRNSSANARAEYYLYIEGFLLHLRNLIAFLSNQASEPADLRIGQIGIWVGRTVEPREYSDLIKKAKEINRKFGEQSGTCHDQISKFLQHCTTHRHERGKSWDIEGIFNELEPALQEFENRFAPTRSVHEPSLSESANSTTSFRIYHMVDDY